MSTKDFEKILQEEQYNFPYHYIPHFKDNIPQNARVRRGFNYLGSLLVIKKYVDEFSPASILDVGCGDGRFLGLVSDDKRRVGVDVSEKAISFARAFHPEVDWRVDDVKNINSSFDLVTAIEVLEHIPKVEIKPFISALGNRCSRGGKIIITVPSENVSVNEKHYRHYDWQMLEDDFSPLLQNKFEIHTTDELLKHSVFFKLCQRIITNSKWVVLEEKINKLFWLYFKKYILHSPKGHGGKLLFILEKTG